MVFAFKAGTYDRTKMTIDIDAMNRRNLKYLIFKVLSNLIRFKESVYLKCQDMCKDQKSSKYVNICRRHSTKCLCGQ